jgi:hypothetical protein
VRKICHYELGFLRQMFLAQIWPTGTYRPRLDNGSGNGGPSIEEQSMTLQKHREQGPWEGFTAWTHVTKVITPTHEERHFSAFMQALIQPHGLIYVTTVSGFSYLLHACCNLKSNIIFTTRV